MGYDISVQQRKFIVKAGMTAEDVKNSKEATSLQKKYASAFDTDGQNGFSQKEADLFNATTFEEKEDGTVTFWTRQKDGAKKGTKFDSEDNNIQYKTEDAVNPYVKKVAAEKAAKEEENVSFFNEKWSGHQIAKLTGDNAVTDWLQDKDKVCTDGKDDGKLSLGQYALSLAKGLIGGIPKAIINHPVATIATIGLCAAATTATCGAILPVLGAIGVTAGVGMVGYGGYKAATAETDGEAKQALETLGMGITTTALAVAGSDKALDQAAKAGVKSAQVSEDAGILDKTVQMFKSTPEAIKVGKNQYYANKLGVTYESYISDGGKVYKSNVEDIHNTADNAVNKIINNANSSGRALNETDYARIEQIRAQEEALIQKLHLKAQTLDKNEHVYLIDADHMQAASVRFGDRSVYAFTCDEYYGNPTCVVGNEGYASKSYSAQFNLDARRVTPDEVKLDVWSKQLDQVSHNNWRYQSECRSKAYDMLNWYKNTSAEYVDFNKTNADKSRLLHYLEYSKEYTKEEISSMLEQFDQAVAVKRAELEAITSNNAKRAKL